MPLGSRAKKVGLVVSVEGDVEGLQEELASASQSVSLFGHEIDVKGAVSLASLAGAAGIAAKGIWEVTQAASASKTDTDALAAAYAAAGVSAEDYAKFTKDAATAGKEMAFSGTEIRDGLTLLIGTTGDAAKANELLGVAQDVARYAGVDLATASKAVALASEGTTGALKRLVPAIDTSAGAADALTQAEKLTAGQADAFAESSEGMGKKVSMAWKGIAISIGKVFLPVLEAVLPALLPLLEAFGQLISAILPILIPLIENVSEVLVMVADALTIVVGWVTKLIEKLGALIGRVRDLLPDLGRLSDLGNRVSGLQVAGASAAQSSVTPYGQQGGGLAGGLTINISGDPATIERTVIDALRTYSRRTGISITGIS